MLHFYTCLLALSSNESPGYFLYLEDYTRQIFRGFVHEIKIPINQSVFHGFMSLAGKGFVAWLSQTWLAGDGCYQQCLLHCACHFADSFGRLGMSTAPRLCHQHHDSGLKSCTELIVINGTGDISPLQVELQPRIIATL